MNNTLYQINKGINEPMEFKGLKAQYIWYLGASVVILLVLFAVLYSMGLPSILCVGIVVFLGFVILLKLYHLSATYGEHGLTKYYAAKRVPKHIRCINRQAYFSKRV